MILGLNITNSNKVGVAQVLNRLTYISSLSHLRRINTPIDKSGKLIPPRKLHPSSWGFICVAETPEGAGVGIVKNLANMTHVTISSNPNSVRDYINSYIVTVDKITPEELSNNVKVFINGSWVGISHKPIQLYNLLKEKKYSGIINIYTSIIFNYTNKEIRVCNDSGRLSRPLLRVKNNKLILSVDVVNQLRAGELTWNDLLISGKLTDSVIEYIDPEEQNYSMIAMNPGDLVNSGATKYNYTHVEIHPSTIFGILASCIPFPEHNSVS